MTDEEYAIYLQLLQRPDEAYIIPNGYAMYLLSPDKSGVMKISTTSNLHEMTDEELNALLVDILTQIIEQE